jgi:hypothetical protein
MSFDTPSPSTRNRARDSSEAQFTGLPHFLNTTTLVEIKTKRRLTNRFNNLKS